MADNRFTQKALQLARAAVQDELRQFGHRFIRRMTLERLSGPGRSSLAMRSGHLAHSLGVKHINTGARTGIIGLIGGGVPYAAIHERGGVILPKRAKNLAIPVGSAKNKSGVSRFGGGPRSAGDLKLIVNRRTGNKLLVRATRIQVDKLVGFGAKRSKLVPKLFKRGKTYFGKPFNSPGGIVRSVNKTRLDVLYVLKPSVTIPARLGFKYTFEQEAKETLARLRSRLANLGAVKF